MSTTPSFICIPDSVSTSLAAPEIGGVFLEADAPLLKKRVLDGIRIPGLQAFLSIGRFCPQGRFDALKKYGDLLHFEPFWVAPSFGKTESELLRETQFLLWERTDGQCGILLPLCHGDTRTSLEGTPDGIALRMEGALEGTEPEKTLVAFSAIGPDPYRLVHDAMRAVAERLGTFRLREDKTKPPFMGYLGWCTWNAFYKEVNEEGVLEGLESFQKGGLLPKFMILDDGWQDYDGYYLNDFSPDKKKLPGGLAPLIQKAKERFGIRIFGVWHAFLGYWWGPHPEKPISQKYRTLKNRVVSVFSKDGSPDLLCPIVPEDIGKFYEDFHAYLREQGVDMLKVDNQGAFEFQIDGKLGRFGTFKAYHDALQKTTSEKFSKNLINCMSNVSDVAFNLHTSNGWRNSLDYYPAADTAAQQSHVHQNAMNALWSSSFAWPDWDMFQTHAPHAEFHAAARAVSGGPVYVSDVPGQQNFALLRKMALADGTALLCDRPALPARDSIFLDCWNEPHLLKIHNRKGALGVIGVFHCCRNADTASGDFSPADIPDIGGERFAVYAHNARTLRVMDANEREKIMLHRTGFEIFTVAPLQAGFAALGLAEKFNSAATLLGVTEEADGWRVGLAEAGLAVFCVPFPCRAVGPCGEELESHHDAETGKLEVLLPSGIQACRICKNPNN